METLKKKYGLLTAIAMVVGVVIGSGVFFKADDVLTITEGNLIVALMAWVVGAFAMIFGSLVFAEFASRIEKANGIVDYIEEAYGHMAGYLAGWFNWVLYFSPLSAILAWVAALYTMILFGSSNPDNGWMTWLLAAVYMILTYMLNYLAPVLAGKFQVTTMFIKLIPLTLIAVVGTLGGLASGVMADNFIQASSSIGRQGSTFAAAVVSTAFAYEGWIIAITLNNEIRDSKKTCQEPLCSVRSLFSLCMCCIFLGLQGSFRRKRSYPKAMAPSASFQPSFSEAWRHRC